MDTANDLEKGSDSVPIFSSIGLIFSAGEAIKSNDRDKFIKDATALLNIVNSLNKNSFENTPYAGLVEKSKKILPQIIKDAADKSKNILPEFEQIYKQTEDDLQKANDEKSKGAQKA